MAFLMTASIIVALNLVLAVTGLPGAVDLPPAVRLALLAAGIGESWMWFVVVGLADTVLLVLLLRFVGVEAYIGELDESHPLDPVIRWLEEHLSNRGETWPIVLLVILSAIHAMDVKLVDLSLLNPLIWWAATFLLAALWVNATLGKRSPASDWPDHPEEAPAAEESRGHEEAPGGHTVATYLREKGWFRGTLSSFSDLSVASESRPTRLAQRQTALACALPDFLGDSEAILDIARHVLGQPDGPKLYSHQARVLNMLSHFAPERRADPQCVCLATPVGSGRSTTCLLAALSKVVAEHQAVMIVYSDPVRGRLLSQQLAQAIERSGWSWAVALAEYWDDSEGPNWVSQPLRTEPVTLPDILLTDISCLHADLLPEHHQWHGFLEQLGLLIVEDIHQYEGLHGAHAAGVFARLARILDYLGTRAQILATSSPCSNLEAFVQRLFSLSPTSFTQGQIVDEDGRGTADKELVVWNPWTDDGTQSDHHQAPTGTADPHGDPEGLQTAVHAVSALLEQGIPASLLHFGRAICPGDLADAWSSWRQIGLTRGRTMDVPYGEDSQITYSPEAELQLDSPLHHRAAVVTGWHGSLSDLLYHLEHLGSGTLQGYASILMVLSAHPLSQLLARTMEAWIATKGTALERIIALDNPHIVEQHVRASIHELPGTEDEFQRWFGPRGAEALRWLCDEGQVQTSPYAVLRDDEQVEVVSRYGPVPHSKTDDRANLPWAAILGRAWTVLVDGKPIMACGNEAIGWSMYQGATLTVAGERFQVQRIVELRHEILAVPLNRPLSSTREFSAKVGEPLADGDAPPAAQTGRLVRVRVTETLTGCRLDDLAGGNSVRTPYGQGVAPRVLDTEAIILQIDAGNSEAAHAICHGVRTVLPLFVGRAADTAEVFPMDDGPERLVVYDAIPGGTGVARWLAQGSNLQRVLTSALELLTGCPCQDGCSRCVRITGCPMPDEDGDCRVDKAGAVAALATCLRWGNTPLPEQQAGVSEPSSAWAPAQQAAEALKTATDTASG